MRDRKILIRALVRAAKEAATAAGGGATVSSVLTGVISGRWSDFQEGRIVIGTSGAGLNTQFSVPPEWDASQVIELAEQALEAVERQPDPTDPLPTMKPKRNIKRLRVNFK